MNREEKIAMLIQRGQIYTYEEWYSMLAALYTMNANKRSPKEDYENYVNEVLMMFPD